MECTNGFTVKAVISPLDSDLVEEMADVILEEIQAIGETIHTTIYDAGGRKVTSYYFVVYMRGLRKIGLYYDTRDKAVMRRGDLMRILGEYKSGRFTIQPGA